MKFYGSEIHIISRSRLILLTFLISPNINAFQYIRLMQKCANFSDDVLSNSNRILGLNFESDLISYGKEHPAQGLQA